MMTDMTAASHNAIEAVPEATVDAVADVTSPAPAPAEAVAAHAAALAAEVADLKDRLLRTLADMENLRRRTERDAADARNYAITTFARDVVGVADNMRRALEAAGGFGTAISMSRPVQVSTQYGPEAAVDSGPALDGPAKALLEGVELTERELHKVLEKHGVRRFDPAGAKFDPNLHQAMFEVPDANVPAGSVVQVVQAGYMIGDRVLRPALVGVSKGGPKAAPGLQPERAEETRPPG